MTESFPAAFVVLTGGRGRRLGEADKAMLVLGGSTLLDRALAATRGRRVVLVGPHRRAEPRVSTTREEPPGGGPAAGIAAGMALLARDARCARMSPVGLLAIDQAGVTSTTWRRLAAAVAAHDATGAVLTAGGRRQYGVGVFRTDAIAAALARRAEWHGISLRELLDPLIGVEVAATATEARDIDTADDLAWWRHREDSSD